MPNQDPLCIAVITGAHGVHGNVRVKTFTEDPLALLRYGKIAMENGDVFKVKSARVHKADVVIVNFESVSNRSQAEALKGTKLYIQRQELPELAEDEFYHADLIGLQAQSPQGKSFGSIAAIYNFGAGDILEIVVAGASAPLMIPFTKACVPKLQVGQGFVVVDLDQALDEEERRALEAVA